MKNKFEQHLKQSLENYEAQYNPADWADLKNRLRKVKAGKISDIGKGLMMGASVATVAGLIYYFSNTNSENNTAEKAITTSQNNIHSQAAEKSVQVESDNRKLEVNINYSKEKVSAGNTVTDEQSISSEKTEMQVENKSTNQKPEARSQKPEINSVPSTSFHIDKNIVCAGVQVQFTIANPTIPCNVKWDFGDGKTSGEQNPKHAYKNAGTYSVKLLITSLKDKRSEEQKDVVRVHPVPVIDMNYSASDENPSAINFEAKNKNGDINEWIWDFGDKQISKQQNPSHLYNKKGSYDVVVIAKNNFGCASSSRKLLNIDNDYNLLAPTGFSPNGDNLNDTWIPVALLDGDKFFTFSIFDQTGNVVYKTSDKNRPWDGQGAKTGETFMWKAVVKDKNGDESNYQGLITISE